MAATGKVPEPSRCAHGVGVSAYCRRRVLVQTEGDSGLPNQRRQIKCPLNKLTPMIKRHHNRTAGLPQLKFFITLDKLNFG
jgi:hypothetical protein